MSPRRPPTWHCWMAASSERWVTVEEFAGGGADLADGVGDGGVGVEAVDDAAAVDGEDVAGLEDALFARHAVDDLLVDGGAEGGGKAVVALEGGDGAEGGDLFDGDALEVHGGGAGDDVGRDGVVDLAKDGAGDAHLFDLGGGFDEDGHKVRLLVTGC